MIEKYIDEYNKDAEYFKIIKLFIYFIKNYCASKTINYIGEVDNIFNFKTNNTVERFNIFLNNIIKHNHPELSFFLEKYKIVIQSAYNQSTNNIRNI